MLITLLCILVVAMIFVSFGKSATLILDHNRYSIFESYFIGLALVGTVLNIWSIFFPTDIYAFIFLLLVSISAVYVKRKDFKHFVNSNIVALKTNKPMILFSFFAVLFILFFAFNTPQLFDSYLYHINGIQWTQYYSVVPGLANLHSRFGFDSSMLVLSAAFTFEQIFDQYIFVISATSILVFMIWSFKNSYLSKGIVAIISLLILYYFINHYSDAISSPGTDFLPNMLFLFLLLTLLFDSNALKNKSLLFTIVPLYCLTLKLSFAPIVFLSLITLYQKYDTKRFIKNSIFIFSIILVPWFVRNIIISGYLIYPLNLNLFQFDWAVPQKNVVEMGNVVSNFAKNPSMNYNEVMKMSLSEWVPIWWQNSIPLNQRFYVLAVLAPFFVSIYFIFKKLKNNLHLIIITSIALAIALFWFFTAPDIRFSFGVILFLSIFPLYLLKDIWSASKKITNLFFGLAFCVFLFQSINLTNEYYRASLKTQQLKNVKKFDC